MYQTPKTARINKKNKSLSWLTALDRLHRSVSELDELANGEKEKFFQCFCIVALLLLASSLLLIAPHAYTMKNYKKKELQQIEKKIRKRKKIYKTNY